MKIPKLAWAFTLESRAGRWAMAIAGCLMIVGSVGKALDPPAFFPSDNIGTNTLFWIVVGTFFVVFGTVLLYRAIKGPPYPRG